MHFSLRLNRDVPNHNKIIKFFDEMDLSKYKSKTSFLTDAVSFYIECIEDGTLERIKDKKFRRYSQEYVTRDEFNERIDNLADSIENKVFKEILSTYLGGVPSGTVQLQKTEELPESEEDTDSGESLAESLTKYSGVMESVLSWSDDD